MIKEPELWELISLELDHSGKAIGEYFEKKLLKKIKRYKKEKANYSKTTICDVVNEALGDDNKRKLVVYGSGYCHHYTYGLCKHADRFSKDYAYVHFDHHTDIGCSNISTVNCASFVQSVLEDTNASVAVFIGRDDPEVIKGFQLSGITEKQLRRKKSFEKFRENLAKLPGEVYLSFDLDVMSRSLITTDFKQGTLTIEELMKCLSLIKKTKHIIGADVLGYTRNCGIEYKKDPPGKEIYSEIVDEIKPV